MAESPFEAALRRIPPDRLRDVLQGVRLGDFMPEPPEGFEALTAYDVVDYLWEELIARPEQLLPPAGWSTFVFRAGRGWGKTRTGAQAVIAIAEDAARLVQRGRLASEEARIHLVGATAADVRDVMIKGPAGILRVSPPWFPARYEPSNRRIIWPGGVEALLFSAEEPDRLRGPQCIAAWADELAAWKYLDDAWDNLEMGCRLGPWPRIIVTTTPRPLKRLKDILSQDETKQRKGETRDNVRNLNPKRVQQLYDKYGKTRLGRQELEGELLDDNPNALWTQKRIDQARLRLDVWLAEHKPHLRRTVVSIDPAMSNNPNSAETGIVVAGVGDCWCQGERAQHGYVFDDVSGILTPVKWAQEAGKAYQAWRADRVIAERNQGGDLVAGNLVANAETKNLPIKTVHVKEGKRLRAEPVAALYEQFKVHHVGMFPGLEDQMTQWDPLDPQVPESPDRVDALVQALTDLMLEGDVGEYETPDRPIFVRRR